MSETSNREERQDQRVFALHHHIQRTITYQLAVLYPPINELSPELSAKLAKLRHLRDERVLPTNDR